MHKRKIISASNGRKTSLHAKIASWISIGYTKSLCEIPINRTVRMHFLHPGDYLKYIKRLPKCNICIYSGKKNLHPGRKANISSGRAGIHFTHSIRMQIIHFYKMQIFHSQWMQILHVFN